MSDIDEGTGTGASEPSGPTGAPQEGAPPEGVSPPQPTAPAPAAPEGAVPAQPAAPPATPEGAVPAQPAAPPPTPPEGVSPEQPGTTPPQGVPQGPGGQGGPVGPGGAPGWPAAAWSQPGQPGQPVPPPGAAWPWPPAGPPPQGAQGGPGQPGGPAGPGQPPWGWYPASPWGATGEQPSATDAPKATGGPSWAKKPAVVIAGVAAVLLACLGVGVAIGYGVWGTSQAPAASSSPLGPYSHQYTLPPTQSVNRAFLGVELQLGSGSGSGSGAHVVGVLGTSPAAKAGITSGDTITSFGSTTVSSSAALRKAVAGYSPGQSAKVGWTTSTGAKKSATVTLTTAPTRY